MADWDPLHVSNLTAPELFMLAIIALAVLLPLIIFWKIVIGRRK